MNIVSSITTFGSDSVHCVVGAAQMAVVGAARGVQTGVQYIGHGVDFAQKSVTNLTKSWISEPYATIIQRAFACLPFAAAYFMVSATSFYLFWAGYSIVHMFHPKPLNNAAYQHLYTGLGVGMAAEMVMKAERYGATGDARHVIVALICLVASNFFLNYGGAFEKLRHEDHPDPKKV